MLTSQTNHVVDDSQAEDQYCAQPQAREKPTGVRLDPDYRRGAEQADAPAQPGRQPDCDTSAERDRSTVEFSPSVGVVQKPARQRNPSDGRDCTQADQERYKRSNHYGVIDHGVIPDAWVTRVQTNRKMQGDCQAEGRARPQPVSDIEELKTFEFI
jgi:hypothetical protein